MWLSTLLLSNFKSYDTAEFTFHPKVNVMVGANGAGKTNLLDAIYYLSFCKSYFASQDAYSIRFGTDGFAIHGDFQLPEGQGSTKIGCLYKNGRKIMRANQKEYERLSDHIGLCPLIMISPYDHDIINNGSEVRRKFFDMIISQCDKPYLHHLIQYQKILQQRNTILKQFASNRHVDNSLLSIYDEQLLPLAENIYKARKLFIEQMMPGFQKYYQFLSNGNENVGLCYQSQLEKEHYRTLLQQSQSNDLRLGYTSTGIHRDDYLFTINEQPLRRYGSQGQQKSFTLALKLAQFDYIKEKRMQPPILLLDDIFDKLDLTRINQLLELVSQQHFGQVFITDTDFNKIKTILNTHRIDHFIFENKNGEFSLHSCE